MDIPVSGTELEKLQSAFAPEKVEPESKWITLGVDWASPVVTNSGPFLTQIYPGASTGSVTFDAGTGANMYIHSGVRLNSIDLVSHPTDPLTDVGISVGGVTAMEEDDDHWEDDDIGYEDDDDDDDI